MTSTDNLPLFIAYAALGAQAVGSVYVGSWGGLKTPAATKKILKAQRKKKAIAGEEEESDSEDEEEDIAEKLTSSDAYWFPIMGSCVLGGLYLLFKYLSPELLNTLLGGYFALLGSLAGGKLLSSAFANFLGKERYRSTFTRWKVLLLKGKEEELRFPFTIPSIVLLGLSFVLSVSYLAFDRPWPLNNFLGLAFSFNGIKLIELDSLATGAILLAGLFFYDIFWVFFTPVMVSVAKGLDAPIKLVWPKDGGLSSLAWLARQLRLSGDWIDKAGEHVGKSGLTMLGLGDIVIPGVFVALTLRLDLHLATLAYAQSCARARGTTPPTASSPFPKPYFTATLIAYFLGLLVTVTVMHTFKAAQPALLYLSPACVGAVALTALARGEWSTVWSWKTEEDKDEKGKECVALEEDHQKKIVDTVPTSAPIPASSAAALQVPEVDDGASTSEADEAEGKSTKAKKRKNKKK